MIVCFCFVLHLISAVGFHVLQIPSNSSLKIALFADMHFGEDSWTTWGPLQDMNSLRVMSTILDLETPDFVVYLGDVITANNIPNANESLYYWDMAMSPARQRGIPWASVFGNHDDAHFEWPINWFSPTGIPHLNFSFPSYSHSGEEKYRFSGTQRVELMGIEIEINPLSCSLSGPKYLWPSVSNYALQVSSDDMESPVAFLYFLDSGGGSYPEVISSAQAKWFEHKSQEINPDLRVPEIVFWHVLSKAYKKAGRKFGIHGPCVGSINKEKVAAQKTEMGIMEALLGRPSVKAVFVGHNHGLDWCCPYEKKNKNNKLWLCFARHTGYGGYGNWIRGARIIELTHKPFSLKSWLRMENGLSGSLVLLAS